MIHGLLRYKNRKNINRLYLTAILLLCTMYAGGCASSPGIAKSQDVLDTPAQPDEQMTWWRAKFQMNWSEENNPRWHVDLILAHNVIAPVLESNHDTIALWRFHRRAGDDDTGHQFSFIFYSKAADTDKIMDEIAANELLVELNQSGILKNVILENTRHARPSLIEETSDPNWSLPLQKAWPHYIMGVSAMWLSLVDQYAADIETSQEGIEMESLYQEVNRMITQTWQIEGRHALLHHMNALFGYTPLNIRF